MIVVRNWFSAISVMNATKKYNHSLAYLFIYLHMPIHTLSLLNSKCLNTEEINIFYHGLKSYKLAKNRIESKVSVQNVCTTSTTTGFLHSVWNLRWNIRSWRENNNIKRTCIFHISANLSRVIKITTTKKSGCWRKVFLWTVYIYETGGKLKKIWSNKFYIIICPNICSYLD